MANITRRGNGFFVRVYSGETKDGRKRFASATWHPDPTKTEKQNQRALDRFVMEFEDRVKSGKYMDGDRMDLSTYAEKWFKEYAAMHLERTTQEDYRRLFCQHVEPELGSIPLARLKPFHLVQLDNRMLQFRKDDKSGGYSPSTIRHVHMILSSMLSTAVDWGIIDANICEKAKPPKQERNASDIKFFTPEQTVTLLDFLDAQVASGAVPLQHKVLIWLAIFTGMRRSELVALKWCDVDLIKAQITVRQAAVIAGKEVVMKKPKSESSNRVVTIPEPMVKLLRLYRTEQLQYRLSLGGSWAGDDSVFIRADGRQMYPSTPYSIFKKLIARCNESLPSDEQLPELTFHDLRHTSATLLISQKIDVRTVSGRLGHAQTSTTMNIYSHMLRSVERQAADTLGELLVAKS